MASMKVADSPKYRIGLCIVYGVYVCLIVPDGLLQSEKA
ncbi:hypothetical protein HMPREF1218_1242 [Hoylesella pleuritidis F0068]|uniref:Uncharacterized protein n=1 Tax=Hoylesella pleuritidis F0068 TaxID=1081904 RepID=U2L3H7_9BACT|nr:hypothetical protein HMPREF1218_1242 [Hoylesella pleuritidis F0068]